MALSQRKRLKSKHHTSKCSMQLDIDGLALVGVASSSFDTPTMFNGKSCPQGQRGDSHFETCPAEMYGGSKVAHLGEYKKINILTLPEEIRRRIFTSVIPINTIIGPTYAQGMLLQGLQGPVLNDSNVCKSENVDAALLRVNKQFKKEVSRLLYGSNRYIFFDACIWKWWLKRIGTANIRSLRSVVLELFSGWSYKVNSCITLCEEGIWSESFHLIRDIHNITHLRITLVQWEDLRIKANREYWNIPYGKVRQVTQARQRTLRNLASLRRFRKVIIYQRECEYLSDHEVMQMTLLMQQSIGSFAVPAPKLSLADAVALIKQRREKDQVQRSKKRHVAGFQETSGCR